MSHSIRHPTLGDAAGVLALMSACDVANLGRPDSTLDQVLEELNDPDIMLDTDAWLAVDERDEICGFGVVYLQGDGDIVEMDVYVHPRAEPVLYAVLWDAAEGRAQEFGRAKGHRELRLDTGVHRGDERTRAEISRRGFTPATVFYRMRIDHQDVVPRPELPPGVTIVTVGD
ncbi:MAG: hypothetical protein ABIM89_15845, partial [Mycobacteriales bacterium]